MHPTIPIYLTPEEVAARLRVTPATVRAWLKSGELRGVRIRRAWRINPGELEAFLAPRRPGQELPGDGGSEAAIDEDDDALSAEDLAAVRRGLADVKAGRVVPWETLRRELGDELSEKLGKRSR